MFISLLHPVRLKQVLSNAKKYEHSMMSHLTGQDCGGLIHFNEMHHLYHCMWHVFLF